MTDSIPGLMGFVIRELKADRDLRAAELYRRATRRYPDVETLTVRQFHARYPLQAKRQLNHPVVRRFPVPPPPPPVSETTPAPPEPPTEPEPPPVPPREALRMLLFRLAMDIETASTRADLVDVVVRMDRYVDEAMAIASR